jgi:hypothetical protein
MPKKLHYVKDEHGVIYDELAKKSIDKRLMIVDDGHVTTFEISDDWTEDEKQALKDVVKQFYPDKKLVKEE